MVRILIYMYEICITGGCVFPLSAGGAIKKKVKPPKDTTLPPLVAKINDTIYVSHCMYSEYNNYCQLWYVNEDRYFA